MSEEAQNGGVTYGRYLLLSQLGRGATGVVYRAWDRLAERSVALKVLSERLTEEPRTVARFHREAQAVARLRHPHIAAVYDSGLECGQAYIAFEWIDGVSLKALLAAEGPLAPPRAHHLVAQIAEALDYSHAHGVIHRDIKPANIIVTAGNYACLVDFGIAWVDATETLTSTGDLVGTPSYVSPEVVRGEEPDGRADQYSLAAVAYEMLSGRPPFVATSVPALLHHHVYSLPPPANETNPALAPGIAAALERGLAKLPCERFASTASFAAALGDQAGSTASAAAPGPPPPIPVRTRRPAGPAKWLRRMIAVAVLCASVLVGALTLSALSSAARPSAAANPTRLSAISNLPSRVRWHVVAAPATDLATGDGLLIFGSPQGSVVALDQDTGRTPWETIVGGEVQHIGVAEPAGGPSVVTALTDNGLYALALLSGKVLWYLDRDSIAGLPTGATLGPDSRLYLASDRGWLYAIATDDATVDWSLRVASEAVFTRPPVFSEGAVYLVSAGAVHAVSIEGRDVIWSAALAGESVASPAVAEPAGVLCLGLGTNLAALSLQNGLLAWDADLGSDLVGLVRYGNYVYATLADSGAAAFNADGGKPYWTATVEGTPTGAPLVDGGVVAVPTDAGMVYYLDAANGSSLGQVALAGAIRGPMVSSRNLLFVHRPPEVVAISP